MNELLHSLYLTLQRYARVRQLTQLACDLAEVVGETFMRLLVVITWLRDFRTYLLNQTWVRTFMGCIRLRFCTLNRPASAGPVLINYSQPPVIATTNTSIVTGVEHNTISTDVTPVNVDVGKHQSTGASSKISCSVAAAANVMSTGTQTGHIRRRHSHQSGKSSYSGSIDSGSTPSPLFRSFTSLAAHPRDSGDWVSFMTACLSFVFWLATHFLLTQFNALYNLNLFIALKLSIIMISVTNSIVHAYPFY
jgi:hypothetical protein